MLNLIMIIYVNIGKIICVVTKSIHNNGKTKHWKKEEGFDRFDGIN